MSLNLDEIKKYLREQPWLGSERTRAAQAFLFLGWGIISLAIICYLFGVGLPQVAGTSAIKVSIFIGILCVLLVYLSELIGVVMVLTGMWFLKSSGLSPEGFSFWNVSSKNWLITIIGISLGIVIWKVFARIRENESHSSRLIKRVKNFTKRHGRRRRKKGNGHSHSHSDSHSDDKIIPDKIDLDEIFMYSLYLILIAMALMYYEIDYKVFDYKIVHLMIGIGAIISIGALSGQDAMFVLGGIGLIILFYNSGSGCNMFETSWKAWILSGFCFWVGYYIRKHAPKGSA